MSFELPKQSQDASLEKPQDAKAWSEQTENPVESFDDLLADIQSKVQTTEQEQGAHEQLNAMLEREKEKKGREAIKPLEKAQRNIEKDGDVDDGEMYYGVLTGNENSYLHREEKRLDSDAALTELEIEKLRAFSRETGTSLYGGNAENMIARKEKTLGDVRRKKQEGFTDEDKANFKKYQDGVLSSLHGRGMAIPVIQENHMGSEGEHWIQNPSQMIGQMNRVREYRRSDKYLGPAQQGAEGREKDWQVQDDVYGYDRVARGLAFGALDAGDVRTAAEALAFAEMIRAMDQAGMDRIKLSLAKLEPVKVKDFIAAYQAEKGAQQ